MKTLFFVWLLLISVALSAVPKWFTNVSDDICIVGNGSAKIVNKDIEAAKNSAREDALHDISMQISTEVRSKIASMEEETDSYSSFYSKEVQISSSVDLCGAETVYQDSDKDIYYIQLKVSKNKLSEYYQGKVENTIQDISKLNKLAQTSEATQHRMAIKLYKQASALWQDLKRDSMILGFLQSSAHSLQLLKEIPRTAELEAKILELQGNPTMSYEDMAEDIIDQLPPNLKQPFTVTFAFYQWSDTGFSSEFSSEFSSFLRAYLASRFQWRQPSIGEMPEISVSGEIMPAGEQICILTRIVTDSQTDSYLTYLSPATIAKIGMEKIEPKDLDQKLADQKQLLAQAKQHGNLKVEIKSGEFGFDPAVYKIGDTASIYVRANIPCYISLVYIEADGAKNVLCQNYFIPEDKTNVWEKIPLDFTVYEPIGIEQLWVQANVIKLPEIPHKRIDLGNGLFKYLSLDSLGEDIHRTRGMAIKQAKTDFTEAFLTWTIVP